MPVRPDLVANRYAGLPSGKSLEYTFQNQETIPIDGTSQSLRDYSPFTLRLVLPEFLGDKAGVDVNLLGRAGQSVEEFQAYSNNLRRAGGGLGIIPGNTYQADLQQRLAGLAQVIASGQQRNSGPSTQERATLVDAYTAGDIYYQWERLLSIPPLTLLVNPNKFDVSYSTVQQYQNKTREGYIFERWGEGQPTISIGGSTGGFIAGSNPVLFGSPPTSENTAATGLQWAARRDSAAFQNFVSLLQFYRNNGYIYDLIGGSSALHMAGGVAIDWDQYTYVGSINSFNYTFDGNNPHRLEWSMEFTVARYYDNASAPVVVSPLSPPGSTVRAQPVRPDSPTPGGGSVRLTGVQEYAEAPLDILVFGNI